jgi:hypothetical protein
MTEKHEIVPIEPVQDSQLLLSLKRNDLEFKAYTSLDKCQCFCGNLKTISLTLIS